jgi:hypothetical protein
MSKSTKILLWILGGALLLGGCCIGVPAYYVYQIYRGVQTALEESDRNTAEHPENASDLSGAKAFDDANRLIGVNTGTTAYGNSDLAKELAADYSVRIRVLRETLFTKRNKEPLISFSNGEFLTYCQLDDRGCLFLVHVPDLRKFGKEAKDQLGELAWETAQQVVRDGLPNPPPKLGVGIRGVVLYDRAMIGTVQPEDSPDSGIEIARTGSSAQLALHRFFSNNDPDSAEMEDEGAMSDEDPAEEDESKLPIE